MVDMWLSVTDAATRLGLSRQAVLTACASLVSSGNAQKVGSRWLVSVTAVEGYEVSRSWRSMPGSESALRSQLESATMLAELSSADANSARLAQRDTEIARLTSELERERRENARLHNQIRLLVSTQQALLGGLIQEDAPGS